MINFMPLLALLGGTMIAAHAMLLIVARVRSAHEFHQAVLFNVVAMVALVVVMLVAEVDYRRQRDRRGRRDEMGSPLTGGEGP